MSEHQSFGDYLAQARRNAKLSLRQLAGQIKKKDGVSISPQYLNDIEHGRRNAPEEHILRQMSTVLDVDFNILMSLAGREPEEVQDYLKRNPRAREAIGSLFRKAREKGFSDWSTLLNHMTDADDAGEK